MSRRARFPARWRGLARRRRFPPSGCRLARALPALVCWSGALAFAAGLAAADPLPDAAAGAASAGRLLFEEGRLPGDGVLSGRLASGTVLSGAAAACASCHLPSGEGAREGRYLIPPVTAPVLFAPGVFAGTTAQPGAGDRADLVPRYETRPAYDDALLRRALEQGVDAANRTLHDPMPRYQLDDASRGALFAWLHQLAASAPLGWSPAGLRVALVLAPEASASRRQAVRGVVEAFAHDAPAGGEQWQVDVFEGGPGLPELAERLEASFAGRPPLVVLSGAGSGDWAPVEAVCARHHTPCLFPVVDLPLPQGSRHALYLSPALGLEAAALARLLDDCGAPPRQWAQAGSARAAAQALASHWGGAPDIRDLADALPAADLAKAAPAADVAGRAVLWGDAARVADWLRTHAPASDVQVFLSGWLAPPESLTVPPRWRAHVRWVSVNDPQSEVRRERVLAPWLARHRLEVHDLAAAADAFAACNLFAEGLAALHAERMQGSARGNFSQDGLLEAVARAARAESKYGVPDYRHLDLAPGQRFAVKSASVLGFPDRDSLRPVLLQDRVAPTTLSSGAGLPR